ncbi:MAG: cupin, partial [Hyphomicrobiaceae bacterium]
MTRGSKIFRAEDVPESNATGYPEPHRATNMHRYARRLGEFAGLSNFGVNVVRIVPGGQSSARHAHAAQDEIVL